MDTAVAATTHPYRPQRRMSFGVWWERFKPIGEPVEGKGSGPTMDEQCRMFETHGKDLATVEAALKKNPATVWTMIEDGSRYGAIAPGFRLVDRAGYFITELPAPPEQPDVKI